VISDKELRLVYVKVQIESLPNLNSTTAAIVVHHGGIHDREAGTSQIALQTMKRATELQSEKDLVKVIDGKGSRLFHSIQKDYSLIGIRTIKKEFERGISTLVEVMSQPLLSEDMIEIEKGNLVQRIRQIKQNPLHNLLYLENDKVIFGENHPYSNPAIGKEETVKSIGREDIVKFFENEFYIKPFGIMIGNFDALSKDEYSNYLRSEIEKSDINFVSQKEEIPPISVPHWNLSSNYQEGSQNAYIGFNFRTKPTENLLSMSRYAAVLIGESGSSRLFKLRDTTGLSYMCYGYRKLINDTGYVGGLLDVASDRVQEAIRAVTDILFNIKKVQIPQQEHQDVYNYLMGKIDLSFDQPEQMIQTLANSTIHNGPKTMEEYYSTFENITPEVFHDWCQQNILPETISLSIDGKFDIDEINETWGEIQNQEV
jgi:predicted Zn-dependent peptidase